MNIKELIKVTISGEEHLGENLKTLCIEYMDNLQQENQKLKDSLKRIVTLSVDEEINKKVQEFQNQLVDRRDQYIAEIMKGIRILHSQNIEDKSMNYKIIFENVTRIEKWR